MLDESTNVKTRIYVCITVLTSKVFCVYGWLITRLKADVVEVNMPPYSELVAS